MKVKRNKHVAGAASIADASLNVSIAPKTVGRKKAIQVIIEAPIP